MRCQNKVYYREGYKYVLADAFICNIPIYPEEDIVTDFIKLTKNGKLIIEKYYAWDGASGPTFDTPSSIKGSLVHDVLYQLMRLELLDIKWRKTADDLLEEICKHCGMSSWRAYLWKKCVNWFAEKCACKENKKEIIIAP